MAGRINKQIIIVSLMLVVLTAAAYEPVRRCQFVNFDDNTYITNNLQVQSGLTLESIKWAFTSLENSNWHPLTWLSHMLDYQLFALEPAGHHIVNSLFHIANTLLLFWLLWIMTGNLVPSAFVAALFALHPLHVESVAWAAERKDVLSSFFFFLTLIAYVRYAKQSSPGRYILVVVLFALGLLSKPMLVTLPFVLLLLDYWPLFRINNSAKSEGLAEPVLKKTIPELIIEKIPLFLLAAASCAVTFYAQNKSGAVLDVEHVNYGIRISNALVSYTTYLLNTAWPKGLAFFHMYPTGGIPGWKVMLSLVLFILITTCVFRQAKSRPYLLMGWLWYVGMLVPVIGLVQTGSQARADRYTYLPLIGIFIIISWYLKEAARHIPAKKIVLGISASVLIIAMIFLTRKQVGVWENDYTLFKHGAESTKLSYEKLCNYGSILSNMGKTDEAIEQYLKAIEDNANFFPSHVNLAGIYLIKGQADEAIHHYRAALQLKPDDTETINTLTYIYLSRGNVVDALMSLADSIRLNPAQIELLTKSAAGFYRLGNIRQTLRCMEMLLNIQPDNVKVLNSAGWVRAASHDENIRDPQKAIHFAQRACELTEYKDPQVLDTLGAAYAAAGNFEKAIETALKAIELARSKGNDDLADKIQTRLDLYRQGKPYLDPNLKPKKPYHGSKIIDPDAKVKILAEGFEFTEGPACDAQGNIFFTDQPNDRIMKYGVDGKLSIFLQPSGRANGLYFDSDGFLWACADEHNQLWRIGPERKVTVVVKDYQGKLLNGPNDTWIRPDGGLYFTDPLYKRPYRKRGPTEQSCRGVYYLKPDRKKLVRVIDDFKQPNGIIGTPDGKTLYVADIGASKTWSYTIKKDGTLNNKKLFCDMGSDGMTIDDRGNVYLTGKGVTVFDRSGNRIAHIPIDEPWTANVCFGGGDLRSLFITASKKLYSIPMQVKGVRNR